MIGRYTTRATDNRLHTTEHKERPIFISNEVIRQYKDVRTLEGLSDAWMRLIMLYLRQYLVFCEYKISRYKTIEYLKLLQNKYNPSTFRKHELQIRRFLRYLNIPYMENIKIVAEPDYTPMLINKETVNSVYEGMGLQFKALISLGSDTGMRPSELYRLQIQDIDMDTRRILIEKTKTGKKRYVFFTPECGKILKEYIAIFEKDKQLKYLFGECHIRRAFMHSGLELRMLRKYFIQQWHRKGGNPLMGEILLGFSTQRNITLRHYLSFSLEEIKKEYDRVMN
jgi:integrase/recombinase XerD